ncbi:hydantoinase B/oxoprolinase family protein [Microvirga massiliensis]|uniref:hydantoinase B/oxoprolinase family protein n=1 Tax=Microvirga massiliensis TaxID=1033741 RepID=UPI00062BC719|nr:hydantoinase B/oxoprolinase family protein [Microvirga massiliensis]
MQPSNPIELAIFNNLLGAIAEEMCAVVERTAYTTFVKETHDFGAGIASPDGVFFAYPRKSGVTSFLGLDLGDAIRQIDDWQPGDIAFTNDPYSTGALVTHLPDLTLLAPIFAEERLIGFCWAFIHSSDIGGRVPGSIAPSSDEVYQEGLRVPLMKLYRAGVLNTELRDIIRTNVRIPYQVWGDLQALISSFHVASSRLVALFKKYGVQRSLDLVRESFDYAEAKARAVIEHIPDGTYRFVDYLEDDLVSEIPVRIELAIAVEGSNIHLDFTGTDPQVLAAFNVMTAGKPHAWLTIGLIHHFLSEDPTIPANGAVIRPIRVTAPEGTLVNPVLPASLGARITAAVKVLEITMGALAQAIPGSVPAAGSGQGMIGVISMPDLIKGGRKVNVFQVLIGGSGGRPTCDGFDATDYSFAFLRNTPAETIEAEMDLLVHEYRYVPDSGGPGTHRGGLGVGITIEALVPNTIVTMRGMERTRFAPWGVHGGKHGGRTQPAILNRGTNRERSIPKLDILVLNRGDVLELASSGGGGYGDPCNRDPKRVLEDVLNGFVTSDAASEIYGVVLRDLEVDAERTARRREAIKAARPKSNGVYDYGPEREMHDKIWSPASRGALVKILQSLPIPARSYAKTTIMRKALSLRSDRSLASITDAEINESWILARTELGLDIA